MDASGELFYKTTCIHWYSSFFFCKQILSLFLFFQIRKFLQKPSANGELRVPFEAFVKSQLLKTHLKKESLKYFLLQKKEIN